MYNFILDFVDALLDIWETWIEKNENVLSKLIFTLITLGFLIVNCKNLAIK